MSAKDNLKPRQKRAAEAYAGPAKGVKKTALLMAGYPESSATHHAAREWTPDMATYARELLDKEGITDAIVVAKHKQLLLKSKVPVVHKGKITAWAPDNDVQARMVQLAYQLKGMLKPDADMAGIVDRLVNVFCQIVVEVVPTKDRAKVYEQLEQALPAAVKGNEA